MNNLIYWTNKWEEVGKDYILNKNTVDENKEVWNNSSKTYDETVSNERVEQVLQNLEQGGYINENSTVLDLGCGTGVYSIPLSGICKKVDALDFSDGMIGILKDKIDLQGIENIEIIKENWDNLDLRAEDMYKKYDLVFCSLNPGCYSEKNLMKMNDASKGYCCYIGTNGRGKDDILNKADYEILGEKVKGCDISNIIYPFNILYLNKYDVEVSYVSCNWTYSMDEERAINKLLKRYNKYITKDNNIEDKIKKFVNENLHDKVFKEKSENTLGILTWCTI